MSLSPTFTTHPRALHRIRDASLPVAGIPSFMCKRCRHQCFVLAGRKKAAGGGWNCASCCGVGK